LPRMRDADGEWAMRTLYKRIADWRGTDFKHKPKSWREWKQEQTRRFRRKDKQAVKDEEKMNGGGRDD